MEFRLVYSGRVLGASRNDSRAAMKHEIRRELHPQLRRVWQTKEPLRELVKTTGFDAYLSEKEKQHPDYDPKALLKPDVPHLSFEEGDTFYREFGAKTIADKWERCGFRFWPLVTEAYCVRCSLEILFLRPEEPGMLLRSGDIDGRLKTLFDALRIPKNLDETGGVSPQDDETPFYCLLEDDKLISEISVTTDQLLLLPKEREIKPNDALVVIHVKVWPTKVAQFNQAFWY